MPGYAVLTKFIGEDKTSAVMDAMGRRSKAFGKTTSAAFRRASISAGVFNGVLGAMGVGALVSRGISGMSRATRELGQQWLDFDSNVTQAAAKFPTSIRRGTMAFKRLGAAARDVGSKTQFTSAQAAGGLNFLAMAGFNASQAIALLPGVTDLATVGHMDLARATDIASDVLGAFGLATKNTAQLQKNFTRVQDVMANTITSTNVDMEQLFETMKFAGPVATVAGASIETFTTAAGAMAQAGIKGSLAGTALRTAFVRLAAPPAAAAKALKKLGVKTKDINGDLKDFFVILRDINKGMLLKKMGTGTRLAALSAIFGRRAVAGMSVLLKEGVDNLEAFREKQIAAGGTSRRIAAEIQKSMINRLATLKSSLIEVGFKFIEAFGSKSGQGIDDLIAKIRKFDVKPVVQGIRDVRDAIKDVTDWINILWPAIEVVGKAWLGYKGIVLALTVIQWGFNLALVVSTKKITLIVVAIVVLIAIVVLLVKRWELVTAVMKVASLYFALFIAGSVKLAKEFANDIIAWIVYPLNLIIRAINKIAGLKIPEIEIKLFTDFDVDNEIIKGLKQDIAKAKDRVKFEAVKTNESATAAYNALVAQKGFAASRDIYRQIPTQATGVSELSDEFNLPTSGPATPQIQAPEGSRSRFEGMLKIVTEKTAGQTINFEESSSAPDFDVKLLDAVY